MLFNVDFFHNSISSADKLTLANEVIAKIATIIFLNIFFILSP
jgi:hypothetical protein